MHSLDAFEYYFRKEIPLAINETTRIRLSSPDPETVKKGKKFIDVINSWGRPTILPGETLIGGNVVVKLSFWDGKVWLDNIFSLDAHKGNGSVILKKITDLADQMEVDIILHNVPFGSEEIRIDKKSLKKWYKKHGWEDVKMYGKDTMLRQHK